MRLPSGGLAGLVGLGLLMASTAFQAYRQAQINADLVDERDDWYHEAYNVYGDRNRLLNEVQQLRAENARLHNLTARLAERLADEP